MIVAMMAMIMLCYEENIAKKKHTNHSVVAI